MNRKEITQRLSRALENHINPNNDSRIYYAKEITFDYGTKNQVRVDYMEFVPINNKSVGIEQGNFYCYEIKSCIEDFKSKHGHNFLGDLNYYVMTEELYNQVNDNIPFSVGVYVLVGDCLVSKVRAKSVLRKYTVSEMLLMMFRSSNRELIKMKKQALRERENG